MGNKILTIALDYNLNYLKKRHLKFIGHAITIDGTENAARLGKISGERSRGSKIQDV